MAQIDDEEETLDLFQEPEGYYKAREKPADVTHRTLGGDVLQLHLSTQNPLWGHLLWQGGRTVADYLEANKAQYVQDKTVLELGAGAGLPSLICAINGAKQVVVTDYPDADLIDNLRANIRDCSLLPDSASNVVATGHIWGGDTSDLTTHLEPGRSNSGFDVVILADLLFNHSEHGKLLQSIRQTLKRSSDAQALVFFTPYRPWLLQKDLAFFDLARDDGFIVEKILEKQMDKVMFEEDPGDETLRRTVFGHRIRWGDAAIDNA
ncbi:Protein N-terminal and lysine N-methyltransferase EFM7 [Cercospora zeina]